MKTWKVYLQHGETGRTMTSIVEAKDRSDALRAAQKKHGHTWFVYAVRAHAPGEDSDAA